VLQITPDERNALRLIHEGRCRCEVAASLEVSERELESRLAVLFAKMGVASEREAADECAKRGLCEWPAAEDPCRSLAASDHDGAAGHVEDHAGHPGGGV